MSAFTCKECGRKITDDIYLECEGYCRDCFDAKDPEQLRDEEDA